MSAVEVRILGELDPSEGLGPFWEAIVKENPASGIMQSLHWARMKRLQGLDAIHFGVFEDNQLIGGALYYTGQRLNGTGIMVAPEGPVLPWSESDRTCLHLRLLKDAAQEYACRHGIISMRIEPRLVPPSPNYLREFVRAPANLVPRETLYVDLRPDQDALLASMKPKGRYNIKLAKRHGVEIEEHKTIDAVSDFYAALVEASQRDIFALESRGFFERLASTLCPAGLASILLAKHEGELLGALLLIVYGERATYLYGGVTNTKRNLMGGYALQWQAMQKARAAGCTTYDFYGYVPHRSPEHEYARFSQFKSQFGGQPMRFTGAQDYFFLDNFAEAFVKVAAEIKNVASEKGEKQPAII